MGHLPVAMRDPIAGMVGECGVATGAGTQDRLVLLAGMHLTGVTQAMLQVGMQVIRVMSMARLLGRVAMATIIGQVAMGVLLGVLQVVGMGQGAMATVVQEASMLRRVPTAGQVRNRPDMEVLQMLDTAGRVATGPLQHPNPAMAAVDLLQGMDLAVEATMAAPRLPAQSMAWVLLLMCVPLLPLPRLQDGQKRHRNVAVLT